MKRPTSIRLSDEALRICAAASKKLGLTTTGAIEMALRLLAEKEKLK